MRLRTANNRKARRKRAATTEVPFCYVEYMLDCTVLTYDPWCDKHLIVNKRGFYGWIKVDDRDDKQRYFPNYKQAIAHLTKVKLSLCKEDPEYEHFIPCKIVEGYVKEDKQTITKVTELPNVSPSIQPQPRPTAPSQRQLQQQRRFSKSLSQAMDSWNLDIRSSGTATGGNPTPTVGGTGYDTWTIPSTYGGTAFSS